MRFQLQISTIMEIEINNLITDEIRVEWVEISNLDFLTKKISTHTYHEFPKKCIKNNDTYIQLFLTL